METISSISNTFWNFWRHGRNVSTCAFDSDGLPMVFRSSSAISGAGQANHLYHLIFRCRQQLRPRPRGLVRNLSQLGSGELSTNNLEVRPVERILQTQRPVVDCPHRRSILSEAFSSESRDGGSFAGKTGQRGWLDLVQCPAFRAAKSARIPKKWW